MAKYTTYISHKVTAITGLENIPEHWEIKQVRYLLLDGQDGIKIGPFGSALKLEDMVEAGYKVYGQENVIKKDFSLGKRWISENKFKTMQVYRVYSGDILITMMGTSGKCEIVPDDCQTGIIDSHLIRLGLQKDKMLPKFFKVLIDGTLEIEYQVKIQGKGSIMHGLNSSIIKSLELPIPPILEQEDILNFLDHETAQIDTLIEKQQTLIKLLKEKRQAVISHAVTKGLNPDAPMKDSGVEWLGDVPEHWEVGSLGYYATLETGATPSRANPKYWDGDIPWVKTGEVKYDTIYDTEEKITDLAVLHTSVRVSPVGTLLMAMYGQGITRGRVALLGLPAAYNQACVAITVNEKVWNEYIKWFFIAGYHAIRDGGNETSQMNLNADLVRKFKILIPPKNEQKEIIGFLLKKLPLFDDLLDKANEQIQLMQERRTALISAAVTGKIDVRGWQAAEQS